MKINKKKKSDKDKIRKQKEGGTVMHDAFNIDIKCIEMFWFFKVSPPLSAEDLDPKIKEIEEKGTKFIEEDEKRLKEEIDKIVEENQDGYKQRRDKDNKGNYINYKNKV